MTRDRTILLVDDNPMNIQQMNETIKHLSNESYQFLNAHGGKQALLVAKQFMPDVIITDWEMPDLDGIGFIQALKSNEQTKYIPVIMATGIKLTSKDLYLALEAGAIDYIRKPINPIECIARVRSAIQHAEQNRDLHEKNKIIFEQERNLLEQQINFLKDEVQYKQKELASSVGFNIQIEKEHQNWMTLVGKLKPYLNNHGKSLLEELLKKAEIENSSQQNLLELEKQFEQVNKRFYIRLTEKVPDITKTEKMLCALLLMDLSQSEISAIIKKNQNSINVAFSRIRNKFQINDMQSLKNLIQQLGNEIN